MARYHVIVESPLGERGGTLILYERGGAVTGTLSLLGVNNPVTGSREGETLTLQGQKIEEATEKEHQAHGTADQA